jgi:peptide deformylase
MIYPIVAYGDPVLKQVAVEIKPNEHNLPKLIEDMFLTMYNANGVGLAAPQIGKSIRLFVVDAEPMDEENLKGFKKAFVNPVVLEEKGDNFSYEEGCLSIPGVRGMVTRKDTIVLQYQNENFETFIETFTGMAARVIQHEYDHLEGKLFTEYLTPLKKQLLKGKFSDIRKGTVSVDYRMRFPR